MERKATFVAIENDGQKRTIENWKKADILLLLEALRVRNQDLYVFMQDCVTKGYRQMNLVTRVRDNILKSKEQKNIQPTKGGHKMVTCQNYVSLFYRQITSCPSDGGIS